MTSAVITADMSQLHHLQHKIDRLLGIAQTHLPDRIGGLLESSARARIDGSKRGPDGLPWADWSRAYAGRRPPGASLLLSSGSLRDATTHEVIGVETITIFQAVEHAATHQYGDPRRNIPARPSLGMSDADVSDIELLVDDLIDEALQ